MKRAFYLDVETDFCLRIKIHTQNADMHTFTNTLLIFSQRSPLSLRFVDSR